jgi:HEAT repeat protein
MRFDEAVGGPLFGLQQKEYVMSRSWVRGRIVLLLCAMSFFGMGCGQEKQAKTVGDLLRELKDSDEALRIKAAEALGDVSSAEAPQAVPALEGALKDPSPHVRQAAAKSLGAFGAEAQAAIPALQKAQSDKDELTRLRADQALKKIQGK